jgi:hypothetical protein
VTEADFCAAFLTGAFAAFAGADFFGAVFSLFDRAFLAATGFRFRHCRLLRCPTRSRYGTGELSDARAGSAPPAPARRWALSGFGVGGEALPLARVERLVSLQELIDSSTIEVASSRGRNFKAIWQDWVATHGSNNLLDN